MLATSVGLSVTKLLNIASYRMGNESKLILTKLKKQMKVLVFLSLTDWIRKDPLMMKQKKIEYYLVFFVKSAKKSHLM